MVLYYNSRPSMLRNFA